MAIDDKLLAAARAAFPASSAAVSLGAVVANGACHPEPLVGIQLRMFNRHGLIAGATGTGKTKTLQTLAEGLSAAGVPVFVSDVKGDLSGLAVPGAANARVDERVKQIGGTWIPKAVPVEFLSLTGKLGAQLRATVSSFGPLALAKTLGLNDTQTSVLAMVFKYCDDKGLPLLDFADLRTVLQYLSGDGAAELAGYGGMSKASVGVLLREMVELEQQGAGTFFGEPEFDVDDLLASAGVEGRVNVLSLSDMQDKPALYSTFMMWMLARLYHQLPEVGDVDKPKLVFFVDEAHLLFKGASKAFVEQVEQVVRLIRSKGVGIFFITQSPKDLPANILGQLGNRIQHALRAFTPEDDKALKAAARTFPKTPFYDVQETLTTLGIGEALVTVLSDNGAPTPPFITRVAPPASRMGPLTPDELRPRLATEQVRRYAEAVDRDSAHEMLSRRMQPPPEAEPSSSEEDSVERQPPPEEQGTSWGDILNSPLARSIAGQVTRGLMGALLGRPPARRRSRRY
jgi:DNA helicase HerA-like ATPase